MSGLRPLPLVASSDPADIPVLAELLDARGATAGAGNRRTLFARMDHILGTQDAAAARPVVAEGQDGESGMVRLTRMRLRNWKAFERADMSFPDETAGKSLVVIGGANGFGKSSILEAYALVLFGQRAFSDIGFLISGAGRRGELRRSYHAMIERSLHRSERAHDDGMCSVLLDFDTSAGPFSIERKWYFDDDGQLIEDEEELLVRVGEDRRPLECPPGQSTQDWYQAEIERRVMPADLAPFFLFDGEQIDRWADRALSDQVRMALTRMLGLVDLHGLAADLTDYARDRERSAGSAESETLEQFIQEIDSGAADLAKVEARQFELDGTLQDLSAARAEALVRLSALGDRTHADLQAQLETQHKLEADRKRLARELTHAIADDGPFLFAGGDLLARARARIEQEGTADGLRLQPEEVAVLWQRFEDAGPQLDRGSLTALRARFEQACAGSQAILDADARHGHLERQTRHAVLGRLRLTGQKAARRITASVAALDGLEKDLAKVRDDAACYAQDLEEASRVKEDLARTIAELAEVESERHVLQSEIAAIRADLDPKRTRLAVLRQQIAETEPQLRAAERAREMCARILVRIGDAADAEHHRFAAAVTANFRALSHKDQIARIDITSTGGLRLLDHDDRDLTDYRLSAGENQLFAMALIAAVGDLVGDRLPLVIDTPLGRLDTEHRQRVLDLLARRKAQTILLTQPEELTAAHLERIRGSLTGTIQLTHAVDRTTGIGVSTVRDDLDELAA